MSQKIVILGCGYVGLALARTLRDQGHAVTGWVRTPESATAVSGAGATPWIGDLADPAAWRDLPAEADTVIHCAATRGGGPEAYRQVYLEGIRRAAAHLPRARLIMVSSTSVYGQTDGSLVTEESPAAPDAETSKVLLQAEAEVLAKPNAIILRSSGIYGLGRGALLKNFQNGTATMEEGGARWINQIHRDDLVSALALAVDTLPGGLYNATDDEPVTYQTYYEWLSRLLGKPMPPTAPPNPDRKRGRTNKRVCNAKLRAAGWIPFVPTFREGLDAVLTAA